MTAKTSAARRPDGGPIHKDLIAFLSNPAAFEHQPDQVRLVETHSSYAFLASPFVYKIKKPVSMGFLDFSTLEKRHYFCGREVTLNRRLTTDVYLGVVPIFRQADILTFKRGEEVVEYAIKMRELKEGYFLSDLVQKDLVKATDLDRIAARLKDFYQAHHPTPEIEAWGEIDRLRISTDENFLQAEKFIGLTISRPVLDAITFYTNEFFARHAALFRSRVDQHWIRDCHGDLHLDHVHITPRELNIYDCIEFNDRLRYIDVANDLAFLAMDLDDAERPDLARHFIEKMALALPDPDLARVTDFYKCYRAFVRGKVESIRATVPEAPESARVSAAENARQYFRLALRYTIARSRPLLLVVMGRIASGKTALATRLAGELGCKIFSSDRVRKEIAGLPLHERGSQASRSHLYSAAMTAKTYESLLAAAESELRAGRNVVLDATFGRRSQRDALPARFGNSMNDLRVIEIKAPDQIIKSRLAEREIGSDQISDARLEDFQSLALSHEPPVEWPKDRLTTVCATGSIEITLRTVLTALVEIQLSSP